MLVSHSPPVFQNSPPTGFLADYASCRLSSEFRVTRNAYFGSAPSHCPKITKPLGSPKRPCLVIRPPTLDESSSDEEVTSPTKLKKKVVFADDRGMSLTHVRFMTEPSSMPPFWTNRFLAEVTQGITADPIGEPWEIAFPQPASDYIEFRKGLDLKKVSLENVIIKEGEKMLVGTVKVSNIAFQKEVFLRCSSDNWKSYEDAFCNFVSNSMASRAYVLYDTFSFNIALPAKSKKLEFCVCYRANDLEFWDNNDEKNYLIEKKVLSPAPLHKSLSTGDMHRHTRTYKIPVEKCVDVIQAKLDAWSEFASWTHLENSNPYW